MEHNLRVYNTLTRQKEPFKTVQPVKVSMYVCGPTVYKPSHLGHMVGPVIFDTVKRYLTYLGYEVTFVVNITDVDDKLIVEAPKQGVSVSVTNKRESQSLYFGSVSGYASPMSPRPAAPRSASVKACSTTSASLWPTRPRACSTRTPPSMSGRPSARR